MSGDIRSILENSEAADSLRMEAYVASCFRSHGWPAEQGVYYHDLNTQKLREIDVVSRHYLTARKPNDFNGSPLINFSIICECKSLGSWNILFTPLIGEVYPNRLADHWCGFGDYAWKAVEKFSSEAAFPRMNKNRVFSYFMNRAHPDHTQLNFHLALSPPPVDMIAAAFRATKAGKEDTERVDPVWSIIQSILSSSAAILTRYSDATDGWIINFRHHVESQRKYASHIANMYDIELARRVLVHRVIFVRSRLFDESSSMSDVNSVRLIVKNLDFGTSFVDIVQFHYASAYIEKMLGYFAQESRTAIRRTLARMRMLDWQPGQDFKALARAFGISTGKPLPSEE